MSVGRIVGGSLFAFAIANHCAHQEPNRSAAPALQKAVFCQPLAPNDPLDSLAALEKARLFLSATQPLRSGRYVAEAAYRLQPDLQAFVVRVVPLPSSSIGGPGGLVWVSRWAACPVVVARLE